MGFLKKIVKKAKKLVKNTIGGPMQWSAELTKKLTGVSKTKQAMIGAGIGLGGLLGAGGLGSLFGNAGAGSAGAATAATSAATGSSLGQMVYDAAGGLVGVKPALGSTGGTTGFFGSLLNGIGSSLGNAAIGLGTNYLTSTYNNKLQQGFNDDAFQKNLLLWNMQNEYNKPINQMKRLEEAGLNPNLMYSAGNVGNAGAVGSQYEPVKNSDMDMNSIMAFQNMANLDAQHELLAQQIELAKLQATGKAIENSFIPEKETVRIAQGKADVANTLAHTDQIVAGDNLGVIPWLRRKISEMFTNGTLTGIRENYGLRLKDRFKKEPGEASWKFFGN